MRCASEGRRSEWTPLQACKAPLPVVRQELRYTSFPTFDRRPRRRVVEGVLSSANGTYRQLGQGSDAMGVLIVMVLRRRLEKQTSTAATGRAQFHRRQRTWQDPWSRSQPQPPHVVRHSCSSAGRSLCAALDGHRLRQALDSEWPWSSDKCRTKRDSWPKKYCSEPAGMTEFGSRSSRMTECLTPLRLLSICCRASVAG